MARRTVRRAAQGFDSGQVEPVCRRPSPAKRRMSTRSRFWVNKVRPAFAEKGDSPFYSTRPPTRRLAEGRLVKYMRVQVSAAHSGCQRSERRQSTVYYILCHVIGNPREIVKLEQRLFVALMLVALVGLYWVGSSDDFTPALTPTPTNSIPDDYTPSERWMCGPDY